MLASLSAPPPRSAAPALPQHDAIEQRLLRGGVDPTPKVLHALRKKAQQKAARRAKKRVLESESPPLTENQRRLEEEEAYFRDVSNEYRSVKRELERWSRPMPSGMPWKRSEGMRAGGFATTDGETSNGMLKGEHLEELRGMFTERNGEGFKWLLDDDIEHQECESTTEDGWKARNWNLSHGGGDKEKIRWLVQRLSCKNLDIHDWKFPKLMRQSDLLFSEKCLLQVLEQLRHLGSWKQAMSVVEWVYNEREYKHSKSRFVYTKLLAVLGKARKPAEALHVFNQMREDCQIYPDLAAYHSIAVTLGQAGLVKELINVIESMRQRPANKLKNMRKKNWDPCIYPDIVIYNSVLNACVPTRQWKGVPWVLQQMRHNVIKPTGATYGLAMEVMMEAGKYIVVHKLFSTMQRNGLALKAMTYKVLVKTLWREGKIDEAVDAVRDMEQRGIVGIPSVYYELACCLCHSGRWRDAVLEVEKLKMLQSTKPIETTFTGMILSSLDGGHLKDCISIFRCMQDHCTPSIGTINAMLKVYCRADLFSKAKELFEATKTINKNCSATATSLKPDVYSYTTMLEASASAHQWEYFEYLYKEMTLCHHFFNQKRLAWTLVEASKAGKPHLLEHAFISILEGGDIPHVSLFMEMLCQTLSEHDHERAITLLNSMAIAAVGVDERQWQSYFEKNRERVDINKLQNLLNILISDAAIKEAPLCDLVKMLEFATRSKSTQGKVSMTNANKQEKLSYNGIQEVKQLVTDMRSSCKMVFSGASAEYKFSPSNEIELNVSDERQHLVDTDKNFLKSDNSIEIKTNLASIDFNSNCFPFTSDLDSDSDFETSTEDDVDSFIGNTGSSYNSDLPLPTEILEIWKQKRISETYSRH